MTTSSSERDLAVARYVGERVHTLIWSRRLTQGAVAAYVGVKGPTFSKKLRGQVPLTVDELMAIARLLDVEPGELLPPAEAVSLPRLDSNQQPSGYVSAQVRDLGAYRASRSKRTAAAS
jgi:transcriptional regulator with XRE-family HTH domain